MFCGHYSAWKANTKPNAKDKANDGAIVKAVPNTARCTDDDDNDDDATWWPVAHCRLGSINNLGHDPTRKVQRKQAAAAAATGQNLLPLVTLANTHTHIHTLKPLCESHIIDLPKENHVSRTITQAHVFCLCVCVCMCSLSVR